MNLIFFISLVLFWPGSALHSRAVALTRQSKRCQLYRLWSTTEVKSGSFDEDGMFLVKKDDHAGSYINKDVFVENYKELESKYVKAEPGRFNFNRLGWYQKRNQDAAISLFKKYSKLRLLTPDEEILAGKFASLARKLHKVRGILAKKFDRDPSDDEWAMACRLSVDQLESYLEISQQSRNRLVQHNIRIAEFWAKKISLYSSVATTVSYAELMIEGIAGLTKAAERYDGRGVRFYHFAEIYVRSAVLQAVTKLKSGSVASHQSVMWATRARKATAALYKQLERQPSTAEVAEVLGVTEKFLKAAIRDAQRGLLSGDQPLAEGFEESALDIFIRERSSEAESIDQQSLRDALMDVLDKSSLLSVEKRCIILRYGLIDNKERSLAEVAELMCMSIEGVRTHLLAAHEKVTASPAAQGIMRTESVRSYEHVGLSMLRHARTY